jgi:hypothetical protein
MTIKNVAARLKETAAGESFPALMGKVQRLLKEAKDVLDDDVRCLLEEAIIDLDEAGKKSSSRKANQYVDDLEDLVKTLEVRISNVGTFTPRWSQIIDAASATASTEEVASPITVGLGQKALADKIGASLGLTTGSLGFEILTGGLAYVLSDPAKRKGQPDEVSVQALKKALLANKVLINKLIGELNDDLGAGK